MNKKKLIVTIIIFIAVIVSVFLFATKSSKKGESHFQTEGNTKVNNSETLHQAKIFEGLEFSEIELTEKDNTTMVHAVVKNKGEAATQQGVIKLSFTDDNGNELGSINWLAPELYPDDSTELSTSAAPGVVGAFDFSLSR